MILEGIGIGLVFSFIFTEIVGLSAGGLIVPGYLAVYGDQPFRIAATLVVALVSCVLVRLISNHMILFSRRRFLVTILVSFTVGWLLNLGSFKFLPGLQDLRAIGFIIPGLIANDMLKQGDYEHSAGGVDCDSGGQISYAGYFFDEV